MVFCGLTANSKHRNSEADCNNVNNDDDDDDDTAEVFLGVNDARLATKLPFSHMLSLPPEWKQSSMNSKSETPSRYYNLSSTLPAASSTTTCQRRHSIGTFLGKEASGNTVATVRQQKATGSKNPLEADAIAASASVDDIDGGSCNDEESVACARTRRRRHRSSSNKGEFLQFSSDFLVGEYA